MHRAVTKRKISEAERGRLRGVTLPEGGGERGRVGRKWTQGRGTGTAGKVSRPRKVWEWDGENVTRQVGQRPWWAFEVGSRWPQGSRRGQEKGQGQGRLATLAGDRGGALGV